MHTIFYERIRGKQYFHVLRSFFSLENPEICTRWRGSKTIHLPPSLPRTNFTEEKCSILPPPPLRITPLVIRIGIL